MSTPPTFGPPSSAREQERAVVHHQLARMLHAELPTLAHVEALAGDRTLSDDERAHLLRLQRRGGDAFFSDVLFVLTHTYVPHETAAGHWRALLDHRRALQARLGRDVGLAVAALDYFTNVTCMIQSAAIIGKHQLDTVAEIALEDGLTGLYDHVTFVRMIEHELRRFQRYGDAFAVLLLDIDDFKRVNDRHGHQKGDAVLRELAELLRQATRETSVIARYGGEEFGIVEPRASLEAASALAERICRRVANTRLADLNITVSVGVAACPAHGAQASKLIEAADEALYRSKRAGKNTARAAR